MARKNLLGDLTAVKSESAAAETPPRRDFATRGAIGAVGQSFDALKRNAVIEVPADMVDDTGGIRDRIAREDDDQAALMESIREYGQQVPVLLRHSPNYEGRYEVIYGRRRVAAIKAMGGRVKALIRNIPTRDLIMAQGQENSARKDLSFIEKANFARQMRALAFERKAIGAALHQGDAVVSKMLTVADHVPEALIYTIGDAPRTGRDRWLAFARHLEGNAEAVEAAMAAAKATDGPSDRRFEAAMRAVQPRKPAAGGAAERTAWGHVKRSGRGTTIALVPAHDEFADWLVERMDELRARWAEETDSNRRKEE